MSKELELNVESKEELVEEKKETAEETWKSIASGFEKPEDLAKAYKEATKALSSDETEFLGQIKKIFGETLKESSKLENAELKSISHALRDKVNVPTRVLDAAVSKTARHIKETEQNNNLADAKSFLKDALKKQAVEKALGTIGGSVGESFQDRLAAGQVSKYELEVLAAHGIEAEESDSSFNLGSETQGKQTVEELFEELQDINLNQAEIWTNMAHPLFKDTVKRKEELKKKLGIA